MRYKAIRGFACPKTRADYAAVVKAGGMSKMSPEERAAIPKFVEVEQGAIFDGTDIAPQSLTILIDKGCVEPYKPKSKKKKE